MQALNRGGPDMPKRSKALQLLSMSLARLLLQDLPRHTSAAAIESADLSKLLKLLSHSAALEDAHDAIPPNSVKGPIVEHAASAEEAHSALQLLSAALEVRATCTPLCRNAQSSASSLMPRITTAVQ